MPTICIVACVAQVTGGARRVGFRSLTEQIDTTTSGGKLIFHVFGALAEFERDLIRERTNAGLADARARIEGLERLIDELATDRDAWKQQAERAQTLIQQAQSLALALPAQVEPVDVAHGPQRPADAPQGATRAAGIWARLRRWWSSS